MRLAACLLLVAVACGSAATRDPDAPAGLSIRTADGTVTLEVEVADTATERQAGLMGRESLDPYDGMAFVWDEPVEATFWMKDTRIPLSIAFWDDQGRIISILDMDPCTGDPCPSYGPERTVRRRRRGRPGDVRDAWGRRRGYRRARGRGRMTPRA